VVEFNAWHYAETDLWASLVERIRQVLLDLSPGTTPEGAEAERRADEARSEGAATAAQLASASDAVEQARRRLRQQRIRAAVVAGLVVVMAVSVGVAVLLGAGAKVVAVATFLAAAFGVVQQTLRARREVAGAGAEVRSTLAHLVGQPEKVAVQEAEERRRHLADEARQLADEAARMKQEADAARERAERNPVGTQIAQLRTVTEYQARLGPIAHTRELFKKIDDAVRASRQRRRRGEQGDDETRLDRVVITIDDLDRCPPEKVVKVLEAVHLMCSFEMFVVLVAVDTRWLDQSLRIRYRELLGRKGTAAPKDYVEKIIQVPIQIPALGETQVQAMIAGLTGQAVVATTQEEDEAGDATEHEGGGGGPVGEALEAERPRPPRPPLPAEVLMVGPEEAPALARVAPIVGTTPRTVKRFVNTYKLIKARSKDPSKFGDRDGGGLHDDEIVSFLLAVNTGHATLAQRLFGALVAAGESETLASVVKGLDADPGADPSAALIGKWLEDHATYADASVTALARWVPEVARFSFVSPDRLPPAGG
jgi:hypothetical protein